MCSGWAFLIPRHLPIETLDILAKKINSWLWAQVWGTKVWIDFLRNTEKIQRSSEEFRRNSDIV
jgi:hypothetical protein